MRTLTDTAGPCTTFSSLGIAARQDLNALQVRENSIECVIVCACVWMHVIRYTHMYIYVYIYIYIYLYVYIHIYIY